MPDIAALLTAYRDRTGDSYDDMSRRIDGAVTSGRLQQLVRKTPRNFPEPRTVEALAQLLQVPVATVVLSLATSLGIDVHDPEPSLYRMLPPGTDNLTDGDQAAVRGIVRALVDARQRAAQFEMAEAEGLLLEQQDSMPLIEETNGPDTQ